MRWTDIFIEAVDSLLSDKVRTFLSILGIIISVGSIITIQIIGNNAGKAISNVLFNEKEGNEIYITVEPSTVNKNIELDVLGECIIPSEAYFTDELLLQFEQEIHCDLQRIQSYNYIKTKIKCEYYDKSDYMNVAFVGCSGAYLNKNYIEMKEGRIFCYDEEQEGSGVALISDSFAKAYFGEESALNKELIILKDDAFFVLHIMGVYYVDEVNENVDEEMPSEIYIPVNYLRGKGIKIDDASAEADYVVKNVEDFEILRKKIYSFFEKNYNTNDWIVEVKFDIDDRKQINQIIQLIVYVVTIIGVLSFIIGGMCVINMMFMIVDEKTFEVGMRKALGARNIDIYIEFLFESLLLVSFGVLAGVVTGCLLGYAITIIASELYQELFRIEYFSIPWHVVRFSIVLSFIIGLAAAIEPMRKVKKLTIDNILRDD